MPIKPLCGCPIENHFSTQYNEEAMTVLQLLGRTGAKINEVIELANTMEKGLPGQVAGEVDKHIHGGAFDAQIDTFLGGFTEMVQDILVRYVTPEMFGAKGDGLSDDSEAIQRALSYGVPVLFGSKTYLCKDIITKACGNVVLIGTGSTVLKWNITNTVVLRDYAAMISDDDMENTPYKRSGNVVIEGITFDGNGANITHFPVTNAFGLCAFYARENVDVRNCTFRNCHADGFMVRGLGAAMRIYNTRFENLGVYQPSDGTRNGITVTREFWSRAENRTDTMGSLLNVTIDNCTFFNIGDEVCRADGVSCLSVRNCDFSRIGMHILETGHMSDGGDYVHEIVNCTGLQIAQGVYNGGADGGGEWPYKGIIRIAGCHFRFMAYPNASTAKHSRQPRTVLVETTIYGKMPDVFVDSCNFASDTQSGNLTYEATSYMFCGENVVLKNTNINYRHISVAQILPCFGSLHVEDCILDITSAAPTYYTMMRNDNGNVKFIRCDLRMPNIHNFITCAKTGCKIHVEDCNVEGGVYEFIVVNAFDDNDVRLNWCTFKKPFTGRPIHTDGSGTIRALFHLGNDFPANGIAWGTISNVNATFKKSGFNNTADGT